MPNFYLIYNFITRTGLGKTLQVISLIEILYRYTELKTVVIVVPICVLNQWNEEFDRYLPQQHRAFKVYSQTCSFNNWVNTSGVLLIGYAAIRNVLTSQDETPLKNHLQHTQLLVFDEGRRLKNPQSYIQHKHLIHCNLNEKLF